MDGFELSDVFCGKTQPVTLFLFSDSLEVCTVYIFTLENNEYVQNIATIKINLQDNRFSLHLVVTVVRTRHEYKTIVFLPEPNDLTDDVHTVDSVQLFTFFWL